eukprot:11209049-Lingulodinium_polyedra.AAC.1
MHRQSLLQLNHIAANPALCFDSGPWRRPTHVTARQFQQNWLCHERQMKTRRIQRPTSALRVDQ